MSNAENKIYLGFSFCVCSADNQQIYNVKFEFQNITFRNE